MAAFDTYRAFTLTIPERDQQGLRDLQSMTWNDLVAAKKRGSAVARGGELHSRR